MNSSNSKNQSWKKIQTLSLFAVSAVLGFAAVTVLSSQWVAQTNQQSCTDSDGGRNLKERGWVTFTTPYTPLGQKNDTCLRITGSPEFPTYESVSECSGTDCLLNELSCNADGNYQEEFFRCPNVCRDGVCDTCGNYFVEANEECDVGPADNGRPGGYCTAECKLSPCTDSDGGRDQFVFGNTFNGIGDNMFSLDFCDGNTLFESYCDNNRVEQVEIKCANDCRDGACLPKAGQGSTCGKGICEEGDDQPLL